MCIWMYVTPPLTKDSELTEDKCILRTRSMCVPNRARCMETRHWPTLGSSGEITSRWLLVLLIPYTVKQALLEMSHSNMSILSPGLLKAERPLSPPPFAFHFSFTSSPPWSSRQKKQLSSDPWISCSICLNIIKGIVHLKIKCCHFFHPLSCHFKPLKTKTTLVSTETFCKISYFLFRLF